MRIFHKLIVQIFFLVILIFVPRISSVQGMMEGGMMGQGDMREMMQRMMDDMLPQPMDPADLPEPESEGAQLLQQFCIQCHYLYGPGLHSAEEWPAVVTRMNRRIQMMGGRRMMMGTTEAPSQEQLAIIVDYLQKHAQKPLPAAQVDELQQTEGGRLFSSVCSRCHPLPDPAQYTARKWPAVVERMKPYMAESGQGIPSEKELEKIVNFLQSTRTEDTAKGNGKKQ